MALRALILFVVAASILAVIHGQVTQENPPGTGASGAVPVANPEMENLAGEVADGVDDCVANIARSEEGVRASIRAAERARAEVDAAKQHRTELIAGFGDAGAITTRNIEAEVREQEARKRKLKADALVTAANRTPDSSTKADEVFEAIQNERGRLDTRVTAATNDIQIRRARDQAVEDERVAGIHKTAAQARTDVARTLAVPLEETATSAESELTAAVGAKQSAQTEFDNLPDQKTAIASALESAALNIKRAEDAAALVYRRRDTALAADELTCAEGAYPIFLHLIDVSDSEIVEIPLKKAIDPFEQWLGRHLRHTSNVATFSSRKILGGGGCLPVKVVETEGVALSARIDAIEFSSDSSLPRSIPEALSFAEHNDWNHTGSDGVIKIVFLYTSGLPGMPNAGLPGMNVKLFPHGTTHDCEMDQSEDLFTVYTRIATAGLRVVLFVPYHLVAHYTDVYVNQYASVHGISSTTTAEEMVCLMKKAVEHVYCSYPPTNTPQTNSCPHHMIMELLYIQDVSYSANEFDRSMGLFSAVMNLINQSFYRVHSALASFSDKSVSPLGDRSDYCYHEDVTFSSTKEMVQSQLDKMEMLSGLDERESQLDALLFGLKSTTIGWTPNNEEAGITHMRAVMLVTDSLPHVHGDATRLVENFVVKVDSEDCSNAEYPTNPEIKTEMENRAANVILLVTPDVIDEWTAIAAQINQSTTSNSYVAAVIELVTGVEVSEIAAPIVAKLTEWAACPSR